MRRIVVVGNCGAGKTRISTAIGERLALPVVHLDVHYWRPSWTRPSTREWRAQVAELVAAEEWVLDGNYGGTFDLRLPRADLVVWVDPHPLVCEYRALSRWWRGRGRRRVDLADGCEESVDLQFLRYILAYRRKQVPSLRAALAEHAAEVPVLRVGSGREVRRWLALLPDPR